jgi:hypothetical protein
MNVQRGDVVIVDFVFPMAPAPRIVRQSLCKPIMRTGE